MPVIISNGMAILVLAGVYAWAAIYDRFVFICLALV
jgi:hypothetical protein